MPLSELNNFMKHIVPIHQVAMLFGPIHNALFDKVDNYLHLPMSIHPTGISSATLPKGGTIFQDFTTGELVYTRGNGDIVRFIIADYTQASLFEALLNALKDDELADFLGDVSNNLAETLVTALQNEESRTVFLKLEEVTATDSLAHDLQIASDYAKLQYAVFTGIARFRARLNGHLTPIVVWPEHFDVSTLWFKDGAMDDSQAHINIGFAPYSPGFELPYFYAYAYPYPDDFEPIDLPSPARWHLEGWRGVVIDYADIATANDTELFIEDMSQKVFDTLMTLL